MLLSFIVLQIILLMFMIFHDWIPIPPFNDIAVLKEEGTKYRLLGSFVNGFFVFIPLLLTLLYFHESPIPFIARFSVVLFYLILTIGTIFSWWVPYFFGSSDSHRAHFNKFKNTHHFLPARGSNVIPNTLHVILHLQVWGCFVFSLYFLRAN